MTPSLPGIAFAVLAASLPLLRAKDVATATAVTSLATKAIPYLFGFHSNLTEHSEDLGAMPSLSLIKEQMRVEHLLKRMDQVLSFPSLIFVTIRQICSGISPRWIWNEIQLNEELQLSLKKRANEKNPKAPISSPLDTIIKDLISDSDGSDDEDGGDKLLTSSSTSLLILCAEACQLRILFEIIVSIPSHYIIQDISSTKTNSPKSHHLSDNKDQYIFISSNLVEIMKNMLTHRFFFDSSTKWKQFREVVQLIDPEYSRQCNQQLVSQSCCEQFEVEFSPSSKINQSLFEICERMIQNIAIILGYLQSITETRGFADLPRMLTKVSTSIVCLYSITVSVENEPTFESLCSRISQQILDFLSLPWEWSKHLIISMSLFLESHPPSSDLENEIIEEQSEFLTRLLRFQGIPTQSLRDNLLCHLVQSSFIFSLILNVILTATPSQDLTYDTISLQLLGLILGVAQTDLDDIFFELSRIHFKSEGSTLNDKLSEWMVLFPYLKILSWRLMGTSSPTTDAEDCLSTFTNKLEVVSSLSCLLISFRNVVISLQINQLLSRKFIFKLS